MRTKWCTNFSFLFLCFSTAFEHRKLSHSPNGILHWQFTMMKELIQLLYISLMNFRIAIFFLNWEKPMYIFFLTHSDSFTFQYEIFIWLLVSNYCRLVLFHRKIHYVFLFFNMYMMHAHMHRPPSLIRFSQMFSFFLHCIRSLVYCPLRSCYFDSNAHIQSK